MKILVITFCRGLNPGTFMQAYGVKNGLTTMFPNADIEFLNFPDYKQKRGGAFGKRDSLYNIFKQKSAALYRKLKYHKLETTFFPMTECIDLFNYDIDQAKSILSRYDLVVVGSDTILETVSIGNKKQIGLNWQPPELSVTPHILFAASASPANFELNDNLIEKLRVCIEGFLYIGLRDNLTFKLFKDKLRIEKEMFRQPDPTYLLNIEDFKLNSYYLKKLRNKNVALFNCNAAFAFKEEMVCRLKEKGYYVVTTGTCPGVDLCINTIGPMEWAGVFKEVSVVLTERFHDTLFALRNLKPVIAFDWQKNRVSANGDSKTQCILEDYGMEENHFVVNSEADVDIVFSKFDCCMAHFNKKIVSQYNTQYKASARNLLKKIHEIVVS